MSPFISESRRRRRRSARPLAPLAAISVVMALVFAMPAFGGPSALSIAKRALKTANKALKSSKSISTAKLVNGAVTSSKIANGAVGTFKITNGAVTNQKLAPGSVGNANLADNSVGTAKLINNSVTGAKVFPKSLSLADLVGADVSGAVSVNGGEIAAHTCAFAPANVPGAQVGQVPLLAFQGVLPVGYVVTALKVPSANSVTIRYCNISDATNVGFTNQAVRVITFG